MTSLDHKDALLPFPILKRFFEVSRLDFQREVMFFSKPFDKSYRIFIPYLITSPNMSTDTPCKVQQKKNQVVSVRGTLEMQAEVRFTLNASKYTLEPNL